MNKALYYLMRSGLYIGAMALLASISYQLIILKSIDTNILLFIFSGTSLSYLSANITAEYIKKKSQYYYLKPVQFFLIPLIILVIISFFRLEMKLQLFYSQFCILILLYPYIFRKINFIKPFFISYCWVAAILGPIYYVTNSNYLYMIEMFLFILCLCLLYDVRDIESDKREGLSNINTWLGPTRTKALAYMLLGISSIITTITTGSITGSFLIFLLGLSLFKKIKINQDDYINLILIDSLIGSKILLLFLL